MKMDCHDGLSDDCYTTATHFEPLKNHMELPDDGIHGLCWNTFGDSFNSGLAPSKKPQQQKPV
jgi:hypothetical protein